MATKILSNVTGKTCYSYGWYMPYFIISHSTLKLLSNQYYWTKHGNTTLLVSWKSVICHIEMQLKTIQRHREQPLYISYNVIIHIIYKYHWISLDNIGHVYYLVWSPPIQFRKEGRGRGGLGTHFQEKQPQVSDFWCATPLSAKGQSGWLALRFSILSRYNWGSVDFSMMTCKFRCHLVLSFRSHLSCTNVRCGHLDIVTTY